MAFLMTVYIVAMAISSEAVPCSKKQHCLDCDETTNLCRTDCDAGYFGLKCSTRCSGKCKNETCKLSSDGIGLCTEGCVTGYQGESCIIPCDSPGGNCTACPAGCDGGYCQLGSSCVSGCVDSYYGTGCKNCSSTCKNCNVMTGECTECQHNYFGNNCELSCEHCQEPCTSGCPSGCVLGFYGSSCSMTCSENCQTHHMDNGEGDTQDLTSACHQQSGDCVHGCTDGWYGLNCSSQCNSKCFNRRCTHSGDCMDDCVPGYFGRGCTPCPVGCWNNTCLANNGSCAQGCGRGLYGEHCNDTCDVCLDGQCDQRTGSCIKGGDRGINIPLLTVCVLFGSIISTTACIMFLRHRAPNRERTDKTEATCQQQVEVRAPRASSQPRDSDHIYSDIDEGDMGPVLHDLKKTMWQCAVLLFLSSVRSCHGDKMCDWGHYGDNCTLTCPENCQVDKEKKLAHCQKVTGACSEGCGHGWYGDQCDHTCSKNCPGNICTMKTGHCTKPCGEKSTRDFCEIVKESDTEPNEEKKPNVVTTIVQLVIISISLLLLLLLLCINVIDFKRRKKQARKRHQESDTEPNKEQPKGFTSEVLMVIISTLLLVFIGISVGSAKKVDPFKDCIRPSSQAGLAKCRREPIKQYGHQESDTEPNVTTIVLLVILSISLLLLLLLLCIKKGIDFKRCKKQARKRHQDTRAKYHLQIMTTQQQGCNTEEFNGDVFQATKPTLVVVDDMVDEIHIKYDVENEE